VIKNIAWIVLGVILVLALYQTLRIRRLISIGKELVVNAVAYEQVPAQADRSILVIGDSSAIGVGAGLPEESVAGRLGSHFNTARITNKGVSGQRLAGLLKEFDPSQLGTHDVLIVHIGGNDVSHLTKLSDVERDLAALIPKTKQVADKVIFISGGDFSYAPFYPWPANHFFGARSERVRDVFKRITAEQGVEYVDLFAADAERPALIDGQSYYAADQFHLNGAGYKGWFDRLLPLVSEPR